MPSDVFTPLLDDADIEKEIAYYNALPFVFDDFIELPELSDDAIHLVCVAKQSGVPEKKWVPSYDFAIYKDDEIIGDISLRIGYTDGLYYGGQIGYSIDKNYRGNGWWSKKTSRPYHLARFGRSIVHTTAYRWTGIG